MTEIRAFGPPGTGKTTYLARQIDRAVTKYGHDRVVVASFTRAAATEIASRGIAVKEENVGTLHALCFRAHGHPTIAETKISGWNASHGHYAMTPTHSTVDDIHDTSGNMPGDPLMAQLQRLRAIMRPETQWPTEVRTFARQWRAFKTETGTKDFTDLIEHGIRDLPWAAGMPRIGFFDEVQDFTPLELTLIRQWSGHMDSLVLAGDDDQCLYNFKGATPDAFLSPPIPNDQKRILGQSYRLPRVIHRYSDRWVKRLTKREVKEFRPRDAEGSIETLRDVDYHNVTGLVDRLEEAAEAGQTSMVLASCGYMLRGVIATLRERGRPFHNPFKRARGDWNPLHVARGISASDRLLAYLRPQADTWGDDHRMWALNDLRKWAAVMDAKIFHRGVKTKLLLAEGEQGLDINELLQLFTENALSAALDGDLEWFRAHVVSSRLSSLAFPLAVLKKHGGQGLRTRPLITLGTIHSVKGGEADNVFIFPDLSVAGALEWQASGERMDAVIRQFYVAMTRAKESLILCNPVSEMAISWLPV